MGAKCGAQSIGRKVWEYKMWGHKVLECKVWGRKVWNTKCGGRKVWGAKFWREQSVGVQSVGAQSVGRKVWGLKVGVTGKEQSSKFCHFIKYNKPKSARLYAWKIYIIPAILDA